MSPALLVGLAASVVAAYVERNRVPPAEVPRVLAAVHAQLSALAAGRTAAPVLAVTSAPRAGRGRP